MARAGTGAAAGNGNASSCADNIGELLEPERRGIIEHEILPPYLARRRWFAAKDDGRTAEHRLCPCGSDPRTDR